MTIEQLDQEFVPLRTFTASSGLPARTIRRHIRSLGIALFEDPQDRRARLIRAEDAAAMRRPRLVRAGGGAQVAAA